MIKTLFTSQTSACFEWQNDLPYYKEKEYKIYLNGKEVLSSNTNIFSLFDLTPGTEYVITSDSLDGEHKFSTKEESCAVNVHDFGAIGDGAEKRKPLLPKGHLPYRPPLPEKSYHP